MTIASRVTDLAAAVRDKINTMMPRLLPSGGTTGQVLAKTSATAYAADWSDPAAGGTEIHVGTTPPASPSVGDLWVDTN